VQQMVGTVYAMLTSHADSPMVIEHLLPNATNHRTATPVSY
jgi:hypothetical protein